MREGVLMDVHTTLSITSCRLSVEWERICVRMVLKGEHRDDKEETVDGVEEFHGAFWHLSLDSDYYVRSCSNATVEMEG